MRMASIDITERKNSEDAAYQNATELRALFQAFPDLFLRLDKSENVLDAKGGQRPDAFLSADKFSGPESSGSCCRRRAGAGSRRSGKSPQQQRHGDGGVRASRTGWASRLMKCGCCRSTGTSGSRWFATSRRAKPSEQRLKDDAQELEQKNEELEKALTAAREATRMKSRFLANMSHEIRTPMNGVLGMTDFLLGTALNAEQQEYAESIKRSADSLLALINDILDLSRIEAGKLRLDQRGLFARKRPSRRQLRCSPCRRAPRVWNSYPAFEPDFPEAAVGDPGRLRQVLTNLLANAIKFTERGTVGLKAEVASQTAMQSG